MKFEARNSSERKENSDWRRKSIIVAVLEKLGGEFGDLGKLLPIVGSRLLGSLHEQEEKRERSARQERGNLSYESVKGGEGVGMQCCWRKSFSCGRGMHYWIQKAYYQKNRSFRWEIPQNVGVGKKGKKRRLSPRPCKDGGVIRGDARREQEKKQRSMIRKKK